MEGKLGLSKEVLPILFKENKPLAKEFRKVYKPFNASLAIEKQGENIFMNGENLYTPE